MDDQGMSSQDEEGRISETDINDLPIAVDDTAEAEDVSHSGPDMADTQWIGISLASEDGDDNPWDDSLLIKAWDNAVCRYKSLADQGNSHHSPDKVCTDLKEPGSDISIERSLHDNTTHKPKKSKLQHAPSTTMPKQRLEPIKANDVLPDLASTTSASDNTTKKGQAPIQPVHPVTQIPGAIPGGFLPFPLGADTRTHKLCPSCSKPPSATASQDVNADDGAQLMMAWYYAGYYTGLHQSRTGSTAFPPPTISTNR
ncbi:hypothetical protein BASA60_006327 [Batrachochytrium salamandrivorans]|nr:hypothetical protein BASA60_006327 [Batrachochytrium salamandrivorans]